MPGVYKRESDRTRGRAGKWTCWWIGADGKRKTCAGTHDKGESERIAREREAEARLVREGIVDPAERKRREAALRSSADHVGDYRLDLLARGNSRRYADAAANALVRLLADAGVESIADLEVDRIVGALGRIRARGRSASTANHALTAIKAFAAWLADSRRIAEPVRGLRKVAKHNEAADRRRVRRALAMADVERLLVATESGPTIRRSPPKRNPLRKTMGGDGTWGRARKVVTTGPERAALYRLAMGTGFRANELRTLTPECFYLDGSEPYIRVEAANEKRRRGTDQPITPELAGALRPFLEGKPPGQPVLPVPQLTARMLREDLDRAGIPAETPDGVIDFHALRATYATHLLESGANPKVVMILLRVSSLDLVMRYAKATAAGVRDALQRKGVHNAPEGK